MHTACSRLSLLRRPSVLALAGLALLLGACSDRSRGSRVEPDAQDVGETGAVAANKPFNNAEADTANPEPAPEGVSRAFADASGGTWRAIDQAQSQRLVTTLRQELGGQRESGWTEEQIEALQVAVEADRIVLSGTAPSAEASEQVQSTLERLAPERRIVNQLETARAAE